jgi:hypothetical protein
VTYTYQLDYKTPIEHSYRSVAFLITENPQVSAYDAFINLRENQEKAFRNRFDAWVGGHLNNDRYHGWNKSEFSGKYTNCFVFEHKGWGDRFYGFLCNPRKSNPGYQLCVLIVYEQKTKHKTNETNLITVESFRIMLAVRTIIRKYERLMNGNSLDRTKH